MCVPVQKPMAKLNAWAHSACPLLQSCMLTREHKVQCERERVNQVRLRVAGLPRLQAGFGWE